jgi:NAD(P)-dependent dehydrogenase (short-subunit alcohol dehydrogenase family)
MPLMSDARVLLVTGGSRGIGAAVCRKAALQGWQVMVNYVSNEAAAQAVAGEIAAAGGVARIVQGDTGTEEGVAAIFTAIDHEFGRLDGLFNNAGVVDLKARLETFSRERLERMFNINVIGAFRCAGEAVRRMSTAHGGRGGVIVNNSSAAALLGGPNFYIDYAATKGAIDTMTIGLAKEVASEGIRVNAVRPGIIGTDIHDSSGTPDRVREAARDIPMQRAGTADEVADAVTYLLSNQASYITGAILNVSGGR